MHKTLAFVDVETTGLNSAIHEVIEISIIKVCPQKGETTFTSKIAPLHIEHASDRALEINGYNPKEWRNAPAPDVVFARVADLLSGCILVGHNVRFDEEFISESCHRFGIRCRHDRRMIDTVTLAFEHLHHLESVSLDSIRQYFGWTEGHRAQIDVQQTKRLYNKLLRASVMRRLYWRASYYLRSFFRR